jgi:O-antigen ligase
VQHEKRRQMEESSWVSNKIEVPVTGKEAVASGRASVVASSRWSERLGRLNFLWLCGLAFALPILETPKNLFAALLLLTFVVCRGMALNFSWRRLDLVDTSLLLMLGATALSTAMNWPFQNGLKGFKDVLVQCVVFWAIYRGGYAGKHHVRLGEMVAIGVLVGLLWGALDVVQQRVGYLQFRSAGVFTQSAIYLGVAFIMTLSIAWHSAESTARFSRVRPWFWWVSAVIMVAALLAMGARGPLAATVVATLAVVLLVAQRKLLAIVIGLAVISVTIIETLPDPFQTRKEAAVTKMQDLLAGRLPTADQQRIAIWRISFKQVQEGGSLIFGVGPRNYASIDYRSMSFDPPLGSLPRLVDQAHNMFLHKLVEEGIVGLASLLFFFGVVLVRLRAQRRRSVEWQWYAAVGALLVPILCGLFADPWRQEHALLSMMLIAMALAPRADASPVSSSRT